jgi:flagellar export protein FliJ
MKRFRFRLERVLRFRITQLDEAKAELIRERLVLSTLEQERRSIEEALDLAGPIIGTITAAELALRALFGEGAKIQIAKLTDQIAEQERIVDQLVDVYREKQQGVRVLEKLKERYRDEYNQEVSRQEIAELDELGVLMRQRANKDN